MLSFDSQSKYSGASRYLAMVKGVIEFIIIIIIIIENHLTFNLQSRFQKGGSWSQDGSQV